MVTTISAATLLKAACTAFTVVLAAALAQRFGPFWGGLIATLPVSSGPAYVLLSFEHDADFIAASALGGFAANIATAVFLVIYARLAPTRTLATALGCALAAWILICAMVPLIAWTPLTASLSNFVVYGASFYAIRSVEGLAGGATTVSASRWWDAPTRAVFVVAFVFALVEASARLGPAATGAAAVFPISLTSLFLLLQPRVGGLATALLAASALRGMVGFGLMLLALNLSVAPLGLAPAMLVALGVSLGWSAGMSLWRRRHRLAAIRHPPSRA